MSSRLGSKPLGRLASGLFLAGVWAGAARAEGAAAGVEGFRTGMEKWVETRQLISKEKADWELDRETLRATRELLAQQKQTLEAAIAELETSSTAADEERRELLLRRAEYQRANDLLAERVRALEQEVVSLARQLPAPLREKLELLLVQIPEDPESAKLSLGQRLISVLGVLAQADKWNATASFVAETRAVGDQKLQVRTLYWGLGQAYFVASQGQSAGIGRPGPDGWEFSDAPELAADARRLLDIYEGNLDVIEFVELPVEIR